MHFLMPQVVPFGLAVVVLHQMHASAVCLGHPSGEPRLVAAPIDRHGSSYDIVAAMLDPIHYAGLALLLELTLTFTSEPIDGILTPWMIHHYYSSAIITRAPSTIVVEGRTGGRHGLIFHAALLASE